MQVAVQRHTWSCPLSLVQDEDGRPPIKMSAADQLARMALGTMEQECGHGIGDAAMGPFVDTHGSILLARRKLDAATRQVRIFLLVFTRHSASLTLCYFYLCSCWSGTSPSRCGTTGQTVCPP